MSFYHIFYIYRGMLLVNGGAALFCNKFPRRKYFWISLVVGLILNCVYTYFQDTLYGGLRNSAWVNSLLYFAQWIITFSIVIVAFKCKVITAVFCATSGYTLQQLVMRLSGFISCYTDLQWVDLLTTCLFCLFIYMPVFYVFRKQAKTERGEFKINNPTLLIVTTLVLVVMIPIEIIMLPYIFNITNPNILASNFLSSAIFAVLAFLLEFNLVLKENYRAELEVVEQIMLKEKEQYDTQKIVVDTINIKCHDLKYQLAVLEEKVDKEEIDKIKTAVDVYDLTYKTGNRALDVVLTTKSLVCKSKNIELTCMVNGEALSFMKSADIYSLFGNILDNAIEAVEKIDDETKRVISITSSTKDGLFFVREENYINTVPEIKDGLIETTKANKTSHGFGMKSIKMIMEAYGGDFKVFADNEIFTIDLMFFPNYSVAT